MIYASVRPKPKSCIRQSWFRCSIPSKDDNKKGGRNKENKMKNIKYYKKIRADDVKAQI